MSYYDLLLAKKLGGGGGGASVTVEELNVTANGTYSASSGYAFNPVNVNVQSSGDTLGDRLADTLSTYTNTTITKVPEYAFNKCTSLKSVNFPNVTSVGESAFYSSGLESALIPNLTTVNASAFARVKLPVISFPNLKTTGTGAFAINSVATEVNLPSAYSIGSSTFFNCDNILTASLPACTSLGPSAFQSCSRMTTAYLPKVLVINNGAFSNCYSLAELSLPQCSSIVGTYAFRYCRMLDKLYLMSTTRVTLSNSNAFADSALAVSTFLGHFGSVYVPSSLLDSYKTANNWSFYSDRFVGV